MQIISLYHSLRCPLLVNIHPYLFIFLFSFLSSYFILLFCFYFYHVIFFHLL